MKQKCFHIEELSEALQKNMIGILRGNGTDYVPFAVVDNYDDAHALCNEMTKLVKRKEGDPA